jgi:hypothetical protein
MARSARCTFATVLVFGFLFGGCVSTKADDHSDGAAAPHDGAARSDGAVADGAGPSADAMAPPTTCREIRICIYRCGQDKACATACASAAPTAARAKFSEVQSCSQGACPDGDAVCRCMEECYVGGMCTDVVDDCDEAVSDPFCDILCH